MHKDDDDFSEGHDIDIKEYFKSLFKSRKHFWQQLKLLVTPEDEFDNVQQESAIRTLIQKKEVEEEEEILEFEVIDPDVDAPELGQTRAAIKTQEEEQEEEMKRIIYNKALPISYIKDFQQESSSKVIVRPPKKKDKALETTGAETSGTETAEPEALETEVVVDATEPEILPPIVVQPTEAQPTETETHGTEPKN